MYSLGFSTGALAYGDFRKALDVLAQHDVTAVELSALRDHELSDLMKTASSLDLSRYNYVSVHAPSRFVSLSERKASDLLSPCIERRWPIVLHPDAIEDPGAWDRFGELLCIENMDKRKVDGRTSSELAPWFSRFRQASFCLDLGHARQVDPSLTVAHELVDHFGMRLRQIHLSELNSTSNHMPLSLASVIALRKIALRLPPVAVIIESVVDHSEIAKELFMAREALGNLLDHQRAATA